MKTMTNISLKKLFFNNKFVIAFSIIFAVIFWMIITVVQAPETEFTINNVPVVIPLEGSATSERGLDVINEDAVTNTVSVTVKGPKYIASSLTPADVSVTASLSNVTTPGKYNLELKASKVTQGEFEIIGTNPGVILASFDYIDTKKFSLIAEAEGASAIAGLIAEKPIVSDSNYSIITVKGPRTELEKIDKIVANSKVNAVLSKTTSYNAEILLFDKDGNSLDKSPFKITDLNNNEITTVEVSVPVSKAKEVPVTVTFSNLPEGLDANKLNFTLDYDKIYIIGPSETIETISSIQLEPIDISTISPENAEIKVKPVLPNGVKVYDQVTEINVKFNNMNSYQVKTFTVTKFRSNDNANAELAAEIKNVKICAPKSVMHRIESSDLTAVADLSGKTAGDHSVDVMIECSETGTIWQIGSYTATVTVK